MTWWDAVAIVCGLPLGLCLGTVLGFWLSEARYTQQRQWLNGVITHAEEALTQAEAIVRPAGMVGPFNIGEPAQPRRYREDIDHGVILRA